MNKTYCVLKSPAGKPSCVQSTTGDRADECTKIEMAGEKVCVLKTSTEAKKAAAAKTAKTAAPMTIAAKAAAVIKAAAAKAKAAVTTTKAKAAATTGGVGHGKKEGMYGMGGGATDTTAAAAHMKAAADAATAAAAHMKAANMGGGVRKTMTPAAKAKKGGGDNVKKDAGMYDGMYGGVDHAKKAGHVKKKKAAAKKPPAKKPPAK